jgi:hypothetical protein
MSLNPQEILTAITLAVSGWTLLRVIKLSENFAAIKQKLSDLPCGDCEVKTNDE